ncbi:hypothetical protein K4K55_004700 [Colletotrichum sp. SAR 10_96]|nr:hypothetical protein K4K55_004700 [Colletotrichum sp. SAR 10_96]
MWTNTMARRVIRDQGRITGVEVESRGDGGRCGVVNVTESTDRVVISGGYYGTPKLLFRSGIGPEDQLRIVQQSTDGPDFIEEMQWIKLPVGRNLHDHTATDLQITHKDVNYYDFQIGAWEGPIQADVDAYLKNRSGMLTMTAPNDGPIMWEVVDGPDGPRQFQYTARVAGATKNSMTISQFLGRVGTSVGTVTINPNLTMSISTLPYQQTKEDKAAIIASIKNLMKALSTDPDIVFTHPPANMTVEQYIEEMPVNLQRRRRLHYLGTAKMGIDSGLEGGTSVVDTHTRVYAAADQVRIRALDIPGDYRRSASLIVNDVVTDLKVSAIILGEDEFLRCLGSSSVTIGKAHNLAMLVGAVRPSIGSSRKEGGDCELLEARKGEDMEKIGLHDGAGNYIGGTIWIEPPYKMLWSNKSIFAILWKMFKEDPGRKWLLPTYVNEAPSTMKSFARKPIFAREGADVVLQHDAKIIQDASTGDYGAEGCVVQELALLPEFSARDGNMYYPVIGLWFIDGDPAGMGIREDRTPITTNTSVFIPHSIEGGTATYEKQRIPDSEEIEE